MMASNAVDLPGGALKGSIGLSALVKMLCHADLSDLTIEGWPHTAENSRPL